MSLMGMIMQPIAKSAQPGNTATAAANRARIAPPGKGWAMPQLIAPSTIMLMIAKYVALENTRRSLRLQNVKIARQGSI